MLLCPDTLGRGRPLVSVGAAAAEYIIGGFRLLHIGAVRTAARERRIIALRYLGGKTQTQVAREIGISQAQVSRLEKAALSRIKAQICSQ